MTKKKVTPFVLGISFLLCFASCSKDQKQPESEIEDRMFTLEKVGWKSKSISHFFPDMEYRATEVPIQYYILKKEGDNDLEKVDSIYQKLKDERVIEVEFQHNKEDDLLKSVYTNRNYEESVKYMSFNIKEDFNVVTTVGDTIACSGVTFERNFKVAPFKRLLLHFGNISEKESIQLIYDDQLFGNGLIKSKFTEIPIKL
ncbi:hypothetical protein D1818_13110 [Aquimarina sp. BL5]|uniref:hypothetical protein n=1 Tax=Aquimarina sp. BL5 TaxID=1714860 RepID=UPI000E4BDFBC|nr:hypothetical protein [Aquimarina sp. BL5]AXT51735.1 hypothetical protein D1818_13110 [Aquimarina sp. BL5]RKN03597.1 hypothetical protein D7036_13560 [Aquimarina sp. BL5]